MFFLAFLGSCLTSSAYGQQKMTLKLPDQETKLSEVTIETTINHPEKAERKAHHEKTSSIIVISNKNQTINETKATFHYDALSYEKYLKGRNGGDSIIVSDTRKGGQFFANILRNAVGTPFSANFDAKGRIMKMSGIDTLSKNVFKTVMRKTDERARKSFEHRVDELFGERYAKGILETLCATLPDSMVKEGGNWMQTTNNLCGLSAKFETQYQLVKINGNIYTIKGTSKISDGESGTFYSENGVGQSLNETEGTAKLTLEIDINTGIVKSGNIEMQFSAKANSLNLNGENSGAPAQKISVESKSTITPVQQ